jgi:hypothetical protein
MDKINRFKKRKKLLKKIEKRNGLSLAADRALVQNFLSSKVDSFYVREIDTSLNNAYSFPLNLEVSEKEANDLINLISSELDSEKFDHLIKACRNDILSAIIGPFGLGGLVANFDKDGGNVDTIRNVKQGTYVTATEKARYENRGKYNSVEYHSHHSYIEKNRADSKVQDAGMLRDAYTGDILGPNENRNLDHTVSAKEIHDDRGRVLAEATGPELANTKSNLHSTAEIINKSKKVKTVEEYLEYSNANSQQREEKISYLSAKNNLSIEEKIMLKKLQTLNKIDQHKMKEIDKKSRIEINNNINKKYYLGKKFHVNVATTGLAEAGKLGAQQAFGLLLCEFFQAVFDELSDIYKSGFSNGFENEHFLYVFKERLKRIARRLLYRWKDAFQAAGSGFLSGFLSNLTTVIINIFIRTGKRVVRIIREGFFSLLKAIKMLCFPPEGMTLAQAAHEATKLIAAGLLVVGGVAVEQHIDNLIKVIPFLEPVSGLITTVLIGGLTALLTTFIVYTIDKLDIFRVNESENHQFVVERMESQLNSMFEKGDYLISKLQLCCS